MKKRSAQSILEYIGVALVFTTAGILTFAAANNEMMLNYRGMYGSVNNTLIGNILGPNNAEPWPEGFNPNLDPVETELGEEGFCTHISGDPESCTEGSGTQGDTGE